jgi:hypothetical protein
MAQITTWEICHPVGHLTESMLRDGAAPTSAIVRISWSSVAVSKGSLVLVYPDSFSAIIERHYKDAVPCKL